jgi:hypothetical protein
VTELAGLAEGNCTLLQCRRSSLLRTEDLNNKQKGVEKMRISIKRTTTNSFSATWNILIETTRIHNANTKKCVP